MSNLREFVIPGCAYCIHLHAWGITCEAYPKGIPLFLASGEVSHETPMSGDHGIQFEWIDENMPEEQKRYPSGDPLGRGGRYVDPTGMGEPINMFETLDMPPRQTSEYEEYMDRVKAEEPDEWSRLPQGAVMGASDWLYAVDDVADDLYPEDPEAFWRFHVDFTRWFLTVPKFDAMSALRASDIVKDLFDQDLLRWEDLAQADPTLVTSLLMEDFDYWAAAATWSGEPADVLGYLAVFAYTLQDMVQTDYPGRDIWALMIEESQQNEFLPFLALMPDPVSFVKAVDRDISHVLRDEFGRWINTPNAGDDKLEDVSDAPVDGLAKIREIKAEIEAMQKAEQDYIAEYVTPLEGKWSDAQIDEMDDARFLEIMMELDPHYTEATRLKKAWMDKRDGATAEILKSLKVDNPVVVNALNDFKTPLDEDEYTSYSAMAEKIGQYISKDSLAYKSGILNFNLATTDRNVGHVGEYGHRIFLPHYKDTDTQFRVLAHEMGHLLELNRPEILEKAHRFLMRRSKGRDANITMGDAINGFFEVEDGDYFHPYVGKRYDKGSQEYATEVISMGFEEYMTNPLNLFEEDREHFNLIYDVLRGDMHAGSRGYRSKAEYDAAFKSHHWDAVLRDESGRWRDTTGSGMDDPSRPTGAPKWASDGKGRKGNYKEFEEKAQGVKMESQYRDHYDAAPTADQLMAGEWEDLGFGPTSYGIWKVTDQEGKEWFVKRMLDFQRIAPKDQSLRERDAGYLGRSLGMNVIPAHEINADDFGDFTPPGLLNTNSGTTGGDRAQPENFFLASPFIDMEPAAMLTGSELADWRRGLPVDTRIKASLFDMFINNTDRHTGNYGIMGDDRSLALIDHSFAFRRNKQGTQSWLNEVRQDTIIDRSYLLWMRGGIEKAGKHMMPGNRKFLQQRYNQIKKWWEQNSAGERGILMTQNLETSGFFKVNRYG